MSRYNTKNPVPSTEMKDLSDNAQITDELLNLKKETTPSRLGEELRTWYGMDQEFSRKLIDYDEQMKQAIINAGYQLVESFQSGAQLPDNKITQRNQALHWPKPDGDGEYYRWDGPLPKVVPANSTPQSTGGVGEGAWIGVGDASLRAALATPSGITMIGAPGGQNLQQYLSRIFIFLDDILPSANGSLDCSAALNAKISEYSSIHTTFIGNASSTYLFRDTINTTGIDNVHINFNGANAIDDVQGFIAESGGRPKQLFIIYNNENCIIENVTITTTSTRANLSITANPTVQLWVGGQYLGSELTKNTILRNIIFKDGRIGMLPISIVGESRGVCVDNIEFYGDYSFMINIEYGEKPEDPSINPTWNNGAHAYNINVNNLYGENLIHCEGGLRTASAFSVKFKNCTGVNVKSFFYCYSGDRGLSRACEGVIYEGCVNHIDSSVLPAVNYCAQIIVVNEDGSTGEALPAWTNYNHIFAFKNCQMWNNNTEGSTCLRFYGDKGKVVVEQCILTGSYYGINSAPSQNPDYISHASLVVRDSVLFNNYRDILIEDSTDTLFESNTIKQQNKKSTLIPVALKSGAHRTKFINNLFDELPSSKSYIIGDAEALDCIYQNNHFEMFAITDHPIINPARASGGGNTTNSTKGLVVDSSASFRIDGEESTGVRELTTGMTGYNADVGDFITSLSANDFNSITGGYIGKEVIIRGAGISSQVSFKNTFAGIPTSDRLINLSGQDVIQTGAGWVMRYKKHSSGWYQV